MLWHKVQGAGGAGAPEGSWDITTLSYTGSSWPISSQSVPRGMTFKVDGTRVYYSGESDTVIRSYGLNTAWSISSVDLGTPDTFTVTYGTVAVEGLFFKPDGTKLYVANGAASAVHEYTLSTPWVISTAGSLQTAVFGSNAAEPTGVFLDPTGTRLYVSNDALNNIVEFSLSVAWDVSTASFSQNFSVSGQDTNPNGVFFKPDGTRMYMIGRSSDSIHQYNLTTAWDISTASFTASASVSAQDINPEEIYIREDGLKLYMIGNGSDRIREYDMT